MQESSIVAYFIFHGIPVELLTIALAAKFGPEVDLVGLELLHTLAILLTNRRIEEGSGYGQVHRLLLPVRHNQLIYRFSRCVGSV